MKEMRITESERQEDEISNIEIEPLSDGDLEEASGGTCSMSMCSNGAEV